MKRLLPGLLLVSLGAQARDWPQWRGPDRDASTDEPGLLTTWEGSKPRLLWSTQGFGKGYAGISAVGDRLYTTGNLGAGQAVIAANRADGAILWSRVLTDKPPKHGYGGSRCTPSVDNGHLYAVLSNGSVVCLRAEDGEPVWRKDFKNDFDGKMMSGWGYSESPLVDGDWVLCTPGGADAMIVALDKLTGDTVWKCAMPDDLGDKGKDGAGYSSIVVSEGAGVKQYVTLVGRGVVSARASDGEFLWNYNPVANGTANIPTVIPDGDHVFCSSGYGTGSALLKLSPDGDGVKAEEVYFLDAKTLQNHHGGMVLKDGHVYVGHKHNSGFPTCVELATGEVKWTDRGPGKGSAAVLRVGDNLVFRYESGDVALIEATPEAYRLKGTFKPDIVKGKCWAHPVVLDGLLYLREQDHLMCWDLRAKP